MKTVGELLRLKSGGIWSVHPNEMAFNALKLMAEKKVGALPVIENDALVGMLSERDFTQRIVLGGKDANLTLVSEIMTPQVICASPDQSLEECMKLMTQGRFRHLPVMAGGKVVGMLSIGDLVKAMID